MGAYVLVVNHREADHPVQDALYIAGFNTCSMYEKREERVLTKSQWTTPALVFRYIIHWSASRRVSNGFWEAAPL